MKRGFIIASVVILLILCGVMTYIFRHKTSNPVVSSSPSSAAIDKEELYAAVQQYMEWGLYEYFANYYFNYASDEQSNHYYQEADAEEIYEILQQIWNISFDYNSITLKIVDSDMELSIPVKIMNQDYQYVYMGQVENDKYKFTKPCLYTKDGKNVFSNMAISLSFEIEVKENQKLIQEGALQKPDEEYVAYCEEWEFLNSGNFYKGDEIIYGTYYKNGDLKEDSYTIQENGQITISNQEGNAWYYKTVKENDTNYLYYGYTLGSMGIEDGYRVKYTKDCLIIDGEKYIHKANK